MINLTKNIVIVKSGNCLSESAKLAITKAKEIVSKELHGGKHIPPDHVTSSGRNPFYNASIIRLFEDHTKSSKAPDYDEAWITNLHTCSKKRPDISLARKVTPNTCHNWLQKGSLDRLSKDATLILHFLWEAGAILLPLDSKKPVEAAPDGSKSRGHEFAARSYSEVLAFARQPFVPHVKYKNMPDVLSVMTPTAIKNFEWYSWRLIRATNWHRVEDVNTEDLVACMLKLVAARRKECDWFLYPIAPQAFASYVAKLFPGRCNFDLNDPRISNYLQGTRTAIERGDFYISEEHKEASHIWMKYQDKHIARLKLRGMKTFSSYEKAYGLLNSYLFEELPQSSAGQPPFPKEFTREYIEGAGFQGLVSYIQKSRSKSTSKGILQRISGFFDYLAANSSLDPKLSGFVNPISSIDFPYVRRSNSTNKAIFSADHFPLLLQFCYSVEAFTWYLAEKVHFEGWNLYSEQYRASICSDNWSDVHKVIETEKLGFVPIVFYKNPTYNSTYGSTAQNRRMHYSAIQFLPRFIVPLHLRTTTNAPGRTSYPQLNYIQHNIVALETGIRTMHIRWLDRRTYDKNIDRSRPLDPICKLFINTDKANNSWNATVSEAVIRVLDRQSASHKWFSEPEMLQEAWYDDHEESPFGKILTLFPRGQVSSGPNKAGPYTHEAYAKFFKRLIFAFDLFCKYNLSIATTNPLPAPFADIDCIDGAEDYAQAISYEKEAAKLIEHTPHSCRASVVSELIKILPPHIIGDYITGHSTVAHVIYYAKADPEYLNRNQEYQKYAIENGISWDSTLISQIKAEDVNSCLQRAFKRNPTQTIVDFGAISFDKETDSGILSGIKLVNIQPFDALAFMSTHVCPFGNNCPAEVIKDLGAIPNSRTPCGGCYYSIKTVDHLPRIVGHIRTITEECAELETYIDEAKKQGASIESLTPKAQYRKFLAAEIVAWSVTVHCLEQMYKEIKTRTSFLVQKPEIVTEQLERIEIKDGGLSNLMARTSEARTHAEFFTPQLQNQVVVARNKLLAYTGRFNELLQETPRGFTLLDEFRGLIRTTCETLNISLSDLAIAFEPPPPMISDNPDTILKLISQAGPTKP